MESLFDFSIACWTQFDFYKSACLSYAHTSSSSSVLQVVISFHRSIKLYVVGFFMMHTSPSGYTFHDHAFIDKGVFQAAVLFSHLIFCQTWWALHRTTPYSVHLRFGT